MLEPLLGSVNRERVLLFILARSEGYGREIARFFETDINPIQKQLEKLELGGILLSLSVGRTRLYSFNPSYPFLDELIPLLEKALSLYPEDVRDTLIVDRRKPKRGIKPKENLSKRWNSWQPET
jgi:hypothetical protein